MSVSSTTTTVSYTGNGSTTSFAVTFAFQGTGSASELTVVERTIATGAEVTKDYTTHYTITGGNGSTGTVIAGSAPADTVQWHIRRNTTTTQTTDYVTNDPFAANTIEGDFDRLAMAGQERDGDIAQSFKYPDTYTGGGSSTFPEPVANAYVLFNGAGDALTTSITAAGQYLGADGTASLPFYSYSGDPNSGFYRIGADNIGLTLGGTKRVDFAAAGTSVTGTLTTSGILSVDDTTVSSSATTGSIHTDGGVGIAKQLFVGGIATHGDDIVSDTDSTDDLGTTGVRWANLFVDAITTTDNQTIGGNLEITGNLTVNGSTNTVDSTNTTHKDPLIELNSGASSNVSDLGLIMERGSTGNNAVILWDESGDFFTVGTTTATADSTGNMTYAFAPFKCSALTATSGTLAGLTSIGMSAGATLTAGFLDEDDMATDSAVAGVTQQSVKAYIDNNAPENGVKFTFETTTTDTDQGAGKIFLNHGTPSSATVLYVDDVEAGGVSVNAWVDTWDDVTNAVARGYVYIAKYGSSNALLVYKVTGAVTSASTYSKVAVTHVVTIGSFADGDSVGLTFVPSGADGSGDLSAANNLSDVASPTTSATNLGLGSGNSPQFTAVNIGHASDTTLARSASGIVTIEGAVVKTAGTETIWVPASAMYPCSTNGCAALAQVETTAQQPEFKVLDFDKDSDEFAQFTVAFPKSWNAGTITYRAYWVGLAATTGVAWTLAGRSVADNAEAIGAFGTAVVVQDDSQGDATEVLISATSGAVTIAGAAADTLTFFQVSRDVSDGNDDMAGDARLAGIQIFFTTNATNDA